ncbi:MAG: hypothetical protein EA402_01290 [Planctomycetota bacterium]|nr:MAG: hypothetical protein EA402_01290 [Planctomycetota bacterium]
MVEPVIVAVPPKGGSLDDVLKRLVSLGWLRQELVIEIRRLIKEDKRRIKLEEGLMSLWRRLGGDEAATMRAADEAGHDLDDISAALRRMRRYPARDGSVQLTFTPKMGVDALMQEYRNCQTALTREAAATLHLELDLTRYGRPTRMMFDHMEFEWRGVHGVLVGTEHEVTPTYLRKHKRDISLTCYDAFHNTLLDALDTGKVRNWQEMSAHLIEANTDVRILGSLGLNDYLGHFVLMPEDKARACMALGGGRRWAQVDGDPKLTKLAEEPLLIDAQFEEIYKQVLGAADYGITFEPTTHDIEQACAKGGRCAVYIVRSGSTIACTPGLCVVGEDLITSESIVAVNQERLDHNQGVGVLVESLEPSDEDRSDAWRARLAAKLGNKLL